MSNISSSSNESLENSDLEFSHDQLSSDEEQLESEMDIEDEWEFYGL